MRTADDIMQGAYDLHVHTYPEFSLKYIPRFKNEQVIQMMIDAGMKGVVLKSHFWPTVGTTVSLQSAFQESGFRVMGSATLNACTGGLTPWAVEAAIRQDAKIIWFPTWSAKNDMTRQGVSKFIRNYLSTYDTFTENQWISLLDENGQLTDAAKTVIVLCKENDTALATGHISMSESIAVAKAAQEIGFKKLILSHPDSHSIGGDLEFVKTMAELGAYIEICALGITPIYQRITPAQLKEFIRTAGAEHAFLSTDYFFEWSATPTEQMRGLIAALMYAGVPAEDVYVTCHDTPEYLLDV